MLNLSRQEYPFLILHSCLPVLVPDRSVSPDSVMKTTRNDNG